MPLKRKLKRIFVFFRACFSTSGLVRQRYAFLYLLVFTMQRQFTEFIHTYIISGILLYTSSSTRVIFRPFFHQNIVGWYSKSFYRPKYLDIDSFHTFIGAIKCLLQTRLQIVGLLYFLLNSNSEINLISQTSHMRMHEEVAMNRFSGFSSTQTKQMATVT